MKLNKKGYMLVEIIVSFSLAFAIAMYLLNLTIDFKDTNEDIYYSTRYLKDKNLITREIMGNLENFKIVEVNVSGNDLIFKLSDVDGNVKYRKLRLDRDNNTIIYGSVEITNLNEFVRDDSYYIKKLESSLMIDNIVSCDGGDIFSTTKKYFCARIPVSSIYDDNNYDINLFSTNII